MVSGMALLRSVMEESVESIDIPAVGDKK
jgi:hypothetical protein